MKNVLIISAIAIILLQACGSTSTEAGEVLETENAPDAIAAVGIKKYQIKSATIKFENKAITMGQTIIEPYVVYFDDYGIKERKDAYDEDGNLKESFFSDGSDLYLLKHTCKKAFKMGKAGLGTEYKVDWEEVSTAVAGSNIGTASRLPNQMIAGKDCEAYFLETKEGKSKFAGWKNICLLAETNSPHVQSLSQAIEIEEGSVAASLFTVPEEYFLEE